jgi:hypothetical protein
VKVKIKNIMWERRSAYFFEVPEFHVYEGDEVKIKWAKPEELALSTGDKEFPFRILQRKNIVEVDGKPYGFEIKSKKEETKFITGSNGKVYEVTANSCTCPGFTFRGSCKHVTANT